MEKVNWTGVRKLLGNPLFMEPAHLHQFQHHRQRGQNMEEKKTLKEGEIICPKCNGTGGIDDGCLDEELIKTCGKCYGNGKLDWIEAAMGKQSRMKMYFTDIPQSMIDTLSEQIAKEIDKEILEKVIFEANKQIKKEGNF